MSLKMPRKQHGDVSAKGAHAETRKSNARHSLSGTHVSLDFMQTSNRQAGAHLDALLEKLAICN